MPEVISSSQDEVESEDNLKINALQADNSISENIGIDFDYNTNNNDVELELRKTIKKSGFNSSINNNITLNKVNLNQQGQNNKSDHNQNYIHSNFQYEFSYIENKTQTDNEAKKINFLRELEKMACSHLNKSFSEDKNFPIKQNENEYISKLNENKCFINNENYDNSLKDKTTNYRFSNDKEKTEMGNINNSNISVEGSNMENIRENINDIVEPAITKIEDIIKINQKDKSEYEVVLDTSKHNLPSELSEIDSKNLINNYQMSEKNLYNECIKDHINNGKIQSENIFLNYNVNNVGDESSFNMKKSVCENITHPRIVIVKQQVFNSSKRQGINLQN